MDGKLLILLVEPGPAAALAPMLDDWCVASPGFDWQIVASGAARARLDGRPASSRVVGATFGLDAQPPDLRALAGSADAVLASCGGRAAERSAMRAGNAGGRATLQFVDTWYGYARRMAGAADDEWADRMLVIDDEARREAAAEGILSERLAIGGHPGWERIQSLPPLDSRDLLFLGAPVRRDYGDRLGYDEQDAFDMIRRVASSRPDLVERIVYAPHPQQEDFDAGDAAVTQYDLALLESCGTVAGMFSAPLVDGFLAGRRVVTVQPDAAELDMCPLSRHGRIPRCRTDDALTAALEAPPPDPAELRSALAGSANRVTKIVLEALGR